MVIPTAIDDKEPAMTLRARISRIGAAGATMLFLALSALSPPPLAAHDITIQQVEVQSEDDGHGRRVFIERAHPRIWSLRQGGYLGVHLVELTPELRAHFGVDEAAGVMIGTVAEESPAATAGLLVGDIITAVDGEPIGSRSDLIHRIGTHDAGEAVSIEVYREGSFQVLQATVEARSRPQLRLDSFDAPGFQMEWRSSDDESVLVLPSPEGPRLEVHGKQLEEVMESLHERLESPDFDARMFEFRSNTEELEQRIKELEERLLELSRQLESLEDD